MRYGPKPNRREPRAIGECDRCAKVVFHHELRRQMLQTQNSMVWSGLLVCSRCLDQPNPQERTPRLRPDPVPIKNPRPVKDGPTIVPTNWPVPED
jgi:hypothetical protein